MIGFYDNTGSHWLKVLLNTDESNQKVSLKNFCVTQFVATACSRRTTWHQNKLDLFAFRRGNSTDGVCSLETRKTTLLTFAYLHHYKHWFVGQWAFRLMQLNFWINLNSSKVHRRGSRKNWVTDEHPHILTVEFLHRMANVSRFSFEANQICNERLEISAW